MKFELTPNEIEIVQKKQAEKHYKKLGDFTITIDGGKLFCYDKKKNEITEATYRTNDVFIVGENNNPKLDVTPDCIYIEALNVVNAKKRLIKGKFAFTT